MRSDDLLAGPRGRRLCHEIAVADDGRPGGLPPGLYGLRECCNWATYWQEPDEVDVALAGEASVPRLRGIAETLAADPSVAWWDNPIALADQHAVHYPDDPAATPSAPDGSQVEPAVRALAAEHSRSLADLDPVIDRRSVSGVWWSAPIAHPGLSTTRSTGPDAVPLGLLAVEDAPDRTVADSWPMRPAPGVRVLELPGPRDWVELVRRYRLDVTDTSKSSDWWRCTGREGGWAMPDWPAVACDWDAVHLSVAGYLTAAGRALAIDDDTATVLAGWPPDTTFWLRNVLTSDAGPTRWARRDDGNWQRASYR